MTDYVVVTGVPPGLAQGDKQSAKQGWKQGLGRQSAAQPSDITSVRPNVPETHDEDDNRTDNPTTWIMSGTLAGETIDTIAQALADYLDVPVAPIKANIEVEHKDHDGILAYLAANAVLFGDAIV